MNFHSKRRDMVNEKSGSHFNPKRQGHGAKLTKAQMYEARYRVEFEGWRARKLEAVYGVSYEYARQNIMGYRTMAGLYPVRSIRPEQWSE